MTDMMTKQISEDETMRAPSFSLTESMVELARYQIDTCGTVELIISRKPCTNQPEMLPSFK